VDGLGGAWSSSLRAAREVELVVEHAEAVSDKERVDSERLEALVRFKGIMLRCCFDGILWS
jgi:hypothetical protein